MASSSPLKPRFLSGPRARQEIEQPIVGSRPGMNQVRRLMPDPPPPVVKKVEPPKAVLVPTIPPEVVREQLGAAVDSLQLHSQRLAEQARNDSLEMAFQIARRITGIEMKQNLVPLFDLVRDSLAELAAARRITLRVCTQDVEALRTQHASRTAAGLSMAEIAFAADPTLKLGECKVDSDLGRLDERREGLQEQRRDEVREAAEGAA